MPGFEISYHSRLRGPISSGAIFHQVDAYEEDVAKELADEGERIVRQSLHATLRMPTGVLESGVGTRALAGNRYELHSNMHIPYAHWIEGSGSRNDPVTVFPGYHNFEDTEEALEIVKRKIARRVLKEHRARGQLT